MGIDVIIAAKEGSQEAINLMINEFTPLVHHMAKQRASPIYYDDYIQVGLMGVMKAVDKTDPKRGGSFSSYVGHRIRGEMALLSCEIRGLKWNEYLLLNRFYKRQGVLEQQQEREIDIREIIEGMKLQPHQVDILKSHIGTSLMSIDASEYDTLGGESHTNVNAEEYLKDGRLRFISEMISGLTEIQAYMVKRFYQDGITQVQIAKEIGWTPASVGGKIHQIKKRFKRKWPIKLFRIAYESEKFYDPDYNFHQERWTRVKEVQAAYMVSNYGRVRSYDQKENKFIIKHPNKDRDSLRYRLNDSGRMVSIPTDKIISMHFTTDELPTFYERK